MNGIILAGGLSTRMGRDKATLPWENGDLLHAVAAALAPACRRLIVVSNTARTLHFTAQVVPDNYPHMGPLAGLEAGLAASEAELNFLAACDMPFLTPAVVRYLAQCAARWDAAVPWVDGRYHPLCASYRRTCLSPVRALLAAGRRRVIDLFSLIKVRPVRSEELAPLDGELRFLININDPAQYASLRRQAGAALAAPGIHKALEE